MEPTVIEAICTELEKAHRSLQRGASITMGLVLAVLLGAGTLFYLAPNEAKRIFLTPPVVAAEQPKEKQATKPADNQLQPSSASSALSFSNEPALALALTVTSKLVLAITAFYIARLLLNIVRYNVKLANRYSSVRFILKIHQANPDIALHDLERLFDVDNYEFLNDKTINSDMSSRLMRVIDARIAEAGNLTSRSTGPAQKAAQAG